MKNFFLSLPNRYAHYFVLLLLSVVLVFHFFSLGASTSFLPFSSDSVRVVIGADSFKESGFLERNIYENEGFSPYGNDENFLYPPLQILVATASFFSGVEVHIVYFVLQLVFVFLLPFSVYFLCKELFDWDGFVLLMPSFFLTTSLYVLRSQVLTPQALFGLLLIVFAFVMLARYVKSEKYGSLLLFLLCYFFVGLLHHLTFFVFLSGVLLIVFFVEKRLFLWVLFIALTVVVYLFFGLDQFHLVDDLGRSIPDPIQDNLVNANGIFNMPAQVGYILFVLGFFGILFGKRYMSGSAYYSLVAVITTVIFLTYAHYVGAYFFPDRIALYLCLVLSFFAPVLFIKLQKEFSAQLMISVFLVLFSAHVAHGYIFQKDGFDFFSSKLAISHTQKNAFNAIEGQGRVLAVVEEKDLSGLLIPYITGNEVTLFHQDEERKSQEHEDKTKMLYATDSERSEALLDLYDIKYVYFSRSRVSENFDALDTFDRVYSEDFTSLYKRL